MASRGLPPPPAFPGRPDQVPIGISPFMSGPGGYGSADSPSRMERTLSQVGDVSITIMNLDLPNGTILRVTIAKVSDRVIQLLFLLLVSSSFCFSRQLWRLYVHENAIQQYTRCIDHRYPRKIETGSLNGVCHCRLTTLPNPRLK